jgi:hypothetical protein
MTLMNITEKESEDSKVSDALTNKKLYVSMTAFIWFRDIEVIKVIGGGLEKNTVLMPHYIEHYQPCQQRYQCDDAVEDL